MALRFFCILQITCNFLPPSVVLHIMQDTLLINPGASLFSDSASVFKAPVLEEIGAAAPYINLYHGHELKIIHHSPVEINDTKPDWFFLVLLLAIALLAYMKAAYTRFLSQMVSAVF